MFCVYVQIYAKEDGGLYFESVMSSGWEECTIIVLSCVIGTVISHAGTACRELLSATSFNVAGNLNKVLSLFSTTPILPLLDLNFISLPFV
jgi:hypothetical protein